MADRDTNREWREHLAQGWARTLIAALKAVGNRGRSRAFPLQTISIGRARVTPRNWVGAHRHDDERATCSRQEVSQGRGGINNQIEQCPGGLSSWNRRGRGQGITLYTSTTQTPVEGRGRGRALAPSSPPSPPLEDHPQAGRCHDGPLRHPQTMPQCLRCHG